MQFINNFYLIAFQLTFSNLNMLTCAKFALRLDSLLVPQLQQFKSDDLIAIHQAEEILRTHLQNPPSIELLTPSNY